jgi:hypothetical protein
VRSKWFAVLSFFALFNVVETQHLVALGRTNTSKLSQQTATSTVGRDPQAIAILSSAVAAAGGLSAVSTIQDYSATGTATYYWGTEPVQATLTVRGMGTTNFRTDATLPSGIRTWAVSNYSAVLISPDGTRAQSSGPYLLNAGSLTLPYVRIAAILADTTTTISYLGEISVNGAETYQIHFIPSFATDGPASSGTTTLGAFDCFIDASSLAVTRISEVVVSGSNSAVTFNHEIDFSNYQTVGEFRIPFTVSEKANNVLTWTITLSSMSFNNGLNDAVFTP